MLSRDRVYNLCNEKRYFTCGTNNQYTEMFKMLCDDKPIHDIALVIWICSTGYTVEEIEQSLKDIEYQEIVSEAWNAAYDIYTDGDRTERGRYNDMQRHLNDLVKEGRIKAIDKHRIAYEVMDACDPSGMEAI